MPAVSRPELTLTTDPSGVVRVKVVYDLVWFWIDRHMDFWFWETISVFRRVGVADVPGGVQGSDPLDQLITIVGFQHLRPSAIGVPEDRSDFTMTRTFDKPMDKLYSDRLIAAGPGTAVVQISVQPDLPVANSRALEAPIPGTAAAPTTAPVALATLQRIPTSSSTLYLDPNILSVVAATKK